MSLLKTPVPARAPSARRVAAALAAVFALVLALPGTAMAAPADLDPSFDADGRVVTDPSSLDEGQQLALQTDGKIVTIGTRLDETVGGDTEFSVIRYNADGSLDTSFGTNGEAVADIGGGNDVGNGIAVQSDGKIVVVGSSEVVEEFGGCCWFTVTRFNANGTLDTAFGDNGSVVTDFGSDGATDPQAVLVQPGDNKIVAVGTSGGDIAVGRWNPDGSPDTTFDGDGRAVTSFPQSAMGRDLALQQDGKIVVAGSSGFTRFDFALVRYNTDGSLDTTFDADGRVVTPFAGYETANGVAVQPDGRIVAAGGSEGDVALARYNANGSLDTGFGTGGRVTSDFGAGEDGQDLALQSDGRIVVAGSGSVAGSGNGDFGVYRYNTNGSLDTGFGTGGRTLTDFGATYEQAFGVAIQPDGKIVAHGTSDDTRAAARYLGGGSAPPPTDADVSVTKAGPATVSISDRATYNLTVRNNSAQVTATNISLSDTLTGPAATLVSASPGQGTCTTTASSATCALGTLAPGTSTTITVVVEPRATGTLTNRATVSATQTDPASANNTATATTTVNNARGCTRIGTSGTDNLTGTVGNDVICALGGNDTVNAGSGNDTVYGGHGDDRLDGSSGNDTLNGGPGNDNLIGNIGNDNLNTVDNVSANDTANGGIGTDTCTTDPADTRISCP